MFNAYNLVGGNGWNFLNNYIIIKAITCFLILKYAETEYLGNDAKYVSFLIDNL